MTKEQEQELLDGEAPQLLDMLVRAAVTQRASDIHLEPKHDRVQVRLRIDGAMIASKPIAPSVGAQMIARVKVLARMDIAERRVPQDGQLSLWVDATLHHLRASTFPSAQGEKVVLRILSGAQLHAFPRLGLDADEQGRIRDIVNRSQGFIVTSGPTGSGKTSTLYAFLGVINTQEVNVVTLEDPIEAELDSVTQGQVNARSGFTFASGLRSILRQDPDVILVGEIRDSETAAIALQAALTGHLVLSTLHTSDAVETVVRLVDLGVEPWIVANALSVVLAQRLVRVVCSGCAEAVPLDVELREGDEVILAPGALVARPRGCRLCLNTGYRGRIGIFEVLELDDDLRELVKAKAATRAYRELLTQRRIRSLRRAGLEKVAAGITTVEEVLRVTI
jgi:general secretion pathway protein E